MGGITTMDAMSLHADKRTLPTEMSKRWEDLSVNNLNCSDFELDNASSLPPTYYWALVFQTGITPANSNEKKCEFFRDACNLQQNTLMRWMCPRTCGCNDPLSGLSYKHAKTGCPMEMCEALPAFKPALGAIECVDPSPVA